MRSVGGRTHSVTPRVDIVQQSGKTTFNLAPGEQLGG
jgi:hypothetical protein